MVRGENTKRIDVLINKWENKAVVLFKWFTKFFFTSSDVKKFYTCRVLFYTDVYQETFSFKAYHIVLTTGLIEIPPQYIKCSNNSSSGGGSRTTRFELPKGTPMVTHTR